MRSIIFRICLTYVYFLIFAQFAFLEHVKGAVGFAYLKPIMGVMGVSGFFTSICMGYKISRSPQVDFMKWGFLICSLSGLSSVFFDSVLFLLSSSMMIGVGLGVLTVSIAVHISAVSCIALSRGLMCGIGTGLAYFICNIPYLFLASPFYQAIVSSVLCFIGACIPSPVMTHDTPKIVQKPAIYTVSFFCFLALCTSLIWFDSAAFFVIQQAGELKSLTWFGEARLWSNASIHLFFAILSGYLIDKKGFKSVFLFSFLFLSLAVLCLQLIPQYQHFSGFLYCAGVSLYSTALICLPAVLNNGRRDSSAIHAGLLFGIAGWLGSAMGIGMAQDLQKIPYTFVIISGLIVFLSQRILSRYFLLVLCGIITFSSISARADDTDVVKLGRAVYISEGCINCHSQYIRPNSEDVVMWGPEVEPNEVLSEVPPLIGNRRNGPDLLNVGIRRSKEWIKVHMIYPRLLMPDSVMPSYGYLFGDERGDALVEYLSSLGKERLKDRLQFIMSWTPKAPVSPSLPDSEVNRLYKSTCAACHGDTGDGRGVATAFFSMRPRNFSKDDYLFSNPSDLDSVARVIKFGVYGTQMPGHEYLRDEEVLALSKYILRMR